jgi:predicted GIY-YIG superfamily endonuclease
MEKQYIYIVQASLEISKCKIGKTCDLERRLTEYNSITGKSQENVYRFLFTCEVSDMAKMEKDIKEQFKADRENKSREIYFYNSVKFENYVGFIKSHSLFVEEIFIKSEDKKEVVKIVKKTTPSLKERGLSPKAIMEKAKKVENDEFYTQYEDVEKEISMYDKSIWQDKTVFCNCDDAIDNDDDRKNSAFSLYFRKHFKELGLKKLICTHYAGKVDLFNQGSKAYVAYISYTTDGEKINKEYPKNYDGSFDHPISLKILKEEADIVCTNPPFSRSIDYWKIMIGSGKQFLIISNIANPITKAFIPYFKNSQVWAGYNRVDYFLNPKRQLTDAAGHWYTNIPIENRPKYKLLKIIPLKNIPAEYKKYDDSKTLLVDNCYIPSNVKKPFAISARPILNGLLEKGYKIIEENESYIAVINGKECFRRVLVQKIEQTNE